MATAFQSNAFQNNAFQIIKKKISPSGSVYKSAVDIKKKVEVKLNGVLIRLITGDFIILSKSLLRLKGNLLKIITGNVNIVANMKKIDIDNTDEINISIMEV